MVYCIPHVSYMVPFLVTTRAYMSVQAGTVRRWKTSKTLNLHSIKKAIKKGSQWRAGWGYIERSLTRPLFVFHRFRCGLTSPQPGGPGPPPASSRPHDRAGPVGVAVHLPPGCQAASGCPGPEPGPSGQPSRADGRPLLQGALPGSAALSLQETMVGGAEDSQQAPRCLHVSVLHLPR